VEIALERSLVRKWPFGGKAHADLVLDAGRDGCWTVWARGSRVFVSQGRTARPTTTVIADASTLADVLEGRRSGVAAWLDGELRLRGSIALAMKLEGLMEREERRAQFPKPSVISVRGVDTFLVDAGQGPPIVMLHGLGATNASFLPTLHELSRDYRVIAPDLPGFGDSGKPLRAYHAGFFAKWAKALLDALGLERAHFIGNSMGGRIALEVALRHPERVDRLALLAPAVAFRKLRQLVPLVRMLRPELAALPMIVPRTSVVEGTRRLFARAGRLEAAWYQAAADEFLRVFAMPRGRIAFFSAAREIYLDPPFGRRGFWSRLESLERPAMFLWGDSDFLVPSAFARHVERCVPQARSLILENCGHVPQFEQPEITHRLVRQFFSEDSKLAS
jgi:pimeloyl-ACP methyl ester carboxylesterase